MKIGPWAFFTGIIIAIVASITGSVVWILGVLGLIVGLLNISGREVRLYLLASLTFLMSVNVISVTLARLVDKLPIIGNALFFVDPLLANIVLFVAPGAVVVALKALYIIAKD